MSRAVQLGVVVGYDVVSAHKDGTAKPDWLQSLDRFGRACARLADVKEVDGPLINGLYAVTFETDKPSEQCIAKIERIGERIFGPFPGRDAVVTRLRPYSRGASAMIQASHTQEYPT